MRDQHVFLIEFNELSPVLLSRFMEGGLLPAFQRFYNESSVYTTDAGEQGETLMPWIAWPSIHSGMPFGRHGVFRLGDGQDVNEAELAQVISDAGKRVGIFGSMNVNYGDGINGYVLPDPWDRFGVARPSSMQPFFDIVSGQVKESSRRESLSKREAAMFLQFLLTHGLSIKTATAVIAQLLDEVRDRGLSWRRASLLDAISYDVFKHYNRVCDVDFATFYSNSTAHYQHVYWRDFEPGQFAQSAVSDAHPSHAGAIEYGYRAMDTLLERFMTDYPEALLMLATAHSQEPDTSDVYRYYRPIDFEGLLRFAGISGARAKAVMCEQFHVEVPDEAAAIEAEHKLQQLDLLGEPALWVSRDGAKVFAGCRYLYESSDDAKLVRTSDGYEVRFGDMFYCMQETRSGKHHPHGALWIRHGNHRVHEGVVSILDIAPTILAAFGIPTPPHMSGRVLSTFPTESAKEFSIAR